MRSMREQGGSSGIGDGRELWRERGTRASDPGGWVDKMGCKARRTVQGRVRRTRWARRARRARRARGARGLRRWRLRHCIRAGHNGRRVEGVVIFTTAGTRVTLRDVKELVIWEKTTLLRNALINVPRNHQIVRKTRRSIAYLAHPVFRKSSPQSWYFSFIHPDHSAQK